ncbi:MAG: LLM class flavin-dependent oxidoreductase [Myxococcota bacterium]|nr:LLM class flavin-dependent oxidoreductase [Myxococcota bacterium]
MSVPLSLLDLAFVPAGQSPHDTFAGCVSVARLAEKLGYRRVWYAEHHNIATIASSATSVLIAHIAAHTSTIRLGAGGVMLPNHAPLVIAEQFGTLASLHPGRIDLGLGRAPGTDPATSRALRVHAAAVDDFADDIVELQGYLGDASIVPGIDAVPGRGTHVPLYILGSSLFGARLAARLGLPYAFASHFAPAALVEAVAIYRREFRPSEQLTASYVIAGVNAIVADTTEDANEQFAAVQRWRVKALLGRGAGGERWTDERAQEILDSPAGQSMKAMSLYSAVGTRSEVKGYIARFTRTADADELMVVHPSPALGARMRSIELLAEANPPRGG